MTDTSSREHITQEAKQQGKALASQVADETRSVTEVARTQGQEMVDEVRSSVRSEAQLQSDRLVQSLRQVGGELDDMAQGKAPTEGIALDAVRRVAAEVQSAAQHLDDRGVDGTLDDLRGYARRRPGMFLAGAFAVGFVGGRLLRNVDNDVLTGTASRSDASRSRSQVNRLEGSEAGYALAETATFADVEETAPGAADLLPGRPGRGGWNAMTVDFRGRAREENGSVAPLGELLGQLGEDVSELFAAEIRLMSLEVREEAKEAAKASSLLVGAAVTAFLTLLLLTFAAAWGLAEVMPEGVAFLIVAIVVGLVAIVLGLAGREQLRRTQLASRQAIMTMKEDVQWAKQQVS